MTLIKRYLEEVSAQLPAAEREDIVAELDSIIEAKLEDELATSGGEPTDAAVATILTGLGHPARVAAQYGAQQFLIGPQLFLPYKRVLKVAIFVATSVQLAFALVSILLTDSDGVSSISVLFNLTETALYVGFWVTLMFAALEYSGEKLEWFEKWDAFNYLSFKRVGADRQAAVTNVITDAVVFIWWNKWFGLDHQSPVTPDAFPFLVTSAYDFLYWPVNAVLLAGLLLYGCQLIQCYWTKARLSIAIGIDVASIAIISLMVMADDLFVLRGQHDELATILGKVNLSVDVILIGIVGFVVYDLYVHLKTWRKLAG